ncbi:MAG: hypothetical protein ACI841_001809 [Planctomycetota bacterium]|jgi:hypothetical protein
MFAGVVGSADVMNSQPKGARHLIANVEQEPRIDNQEQDAEPARNFWSTVPAKPKHCYRPETAGTGHDQDQPIVPADEGHKVEARSQSRD